MSKIKKPVKPSAKEIQAEIRKLKALKPKVPSRNFFGDDNHASIEAEINVLENMLDDDAIYDAYEPQEYDGNRSELDSALDVRRWLDGDSTDGAPSAGWEPLIKGKR